MKRIEQFIYIQTFIHIRTVAHNIKKLNHLPQTVQKCV
jgi:hypothetical protein